MAKAVLFPGSFDPFTLGHKVVVDQALELFGRVVIAVGANNDKKHLITTENRVRLIEDIYRCDDRVEVRSYDNLTGEFCREMGITTIIRGIRNSVDFEYERNISHVSQTLFPELNVVMLFTPIEYIAISSSVIRELMAFGKDPKELMPENIDIKDYL